MTTTAVLLVAVFGALGITARHIGNWEYQHSEDWHFMWWYLAAAINIIFAATVIGGGV